MPTWLKVVLIIGAVFLALIVGSGFLMLRWARSHQAQIMAARNAGAEAGRGKTASDCIDASMKRIAPGGSLDAQLDGRMFADGCFSTASDLQTFCSQVPSSFVAGAQWPMAECRRRAYADQRACIQVLQSATQVCRMRSMGR